MSLALCICPQPCSQGPLSSSLEKREDPGSEVVVEFVPSRDLEPQRLSFVTEGAFY